MHDRLLFALMLVPALSRLAVAEPLIVAHRGASHDAPENTLAAFRLAWEQGADAIEGDFRLTADRRIVCIHDANTKRTAGTNLVVAQSILAELRALDVGTWKGASWAGERMPTLEEVLATVPPDKKIFIELKSGPEIVAPLREILAQSSLRPDQTIVIAFDAAVVAATKRQIPGIRVYWLTSFKRDTPLGAWKPKLADILETLKTTGADGLDSEAHDQADATLAAALRQARLSFHVWTVDKPAVARKFRQLGVESITTNRPGWLREQLRRSQEP